VRGLSKEDTVAENNSMSREQQARAAHTCYRPSLRSRIEGKAGVYQVTRSDDGCHTITDDGLLLTCSCGALACHHMADLLMTGLIVCAAVLEVG